MSRTITKLISCKLKGTFEKWVKIFDSKEAEIKYFKFDIKPLFRGFSKDGSKKVIYMHQATEVNIQKLVQSNSEWIKSHKNEFSTMEESAWI